MLLALAGFAACDPAATVVFVAPNHSTLAETRAEIAATPRQREVGLMYRNHLDADASMLFVFPSAQPVQFWMKNTEIPLDMIFADGSGRVTAIVANAEPYSEKPIGPSSDTEYVVEVNGGYAARHLIATGDQLCFAGLPPARRNRSRRFCTALFARACDIDS